jgi:radical SAM superfamily enzyme YgiQ (UPF0313 family)
MAKESGIQVALSFILGLPFDTRETIEATIALAKKFPVELAYFFIAVPLPGTELYNIVKKEGKFVFDLEKKGITHTEGKPYYKIKGLEEDMLVALHKKAYRSFYLRPIQIWRIIRGLRFYSPFSVFKAILHIPDFIKNKLTIYS